MGFCLTFTVVLLVMRFGLTWNLPCLGYFGLLLICLFVLMSLDLCLMFWIFEVDGVGGFVCFGYLFVVCWV